MSSTPPHRLLLIEDDAVTEFVTRSILQEHNCFRHVHAAATLHAADRILECYGISMILTDLELRQGNVWHWLEAIDGRLGRTIPVVVLTASQRREDQAKAQANSVVKAFLQKPLSGHHISTLLDAIEP